MPKGKKGGKKEKKGKKDGKKVKKAESFAAIAAANEKVWEARLDKTDRAKDEYRENAKRLLLENEELQSQLMTTERDTIDVISYLKKQDQEKETQLELFQEQVQEMQSFHRLEKDSIVQQFTRQINKLEDCLGEKMREVEIMQSELKMVKEFRRKRGLMQKELDEIKESMHSATRDHKATLENMEDKFFKEKMRLQQEANQKIAELAEKAHTEAIANLDESTKSVYKENVRLTEALNYHMKEGDLLKKECERLSEENEVLNKEKMGDSTAVQEKVVQVKMQKELVTELENKVKTLEKSLSHVVSEFETERDLILENADIEAEAARIELVKLQRVMEMKTKEMVRVKRLARNILDQRTPLERQCIDALESVKQDILAERFAQQKAVFEHKMVTDGSKTGSQAASADKAHKLGGKLYGVSGKVDIGDLTWEQRERVLRYLFNSINSSTNPPPGQEQFRNTSLPPLSNLDKEAEGYDDSQTFLTQAHLDVDLGEASPQ